MLLVLAQALYEFVNELINAPLPENPLCDLCETDGSDESDDSRLAEDSFFDDSRLGSDEIFDQDLVLSSVPDNN